MYSVDSSVLVRLITNDDPKQGKRAATLFSAHQIFVPITVLLETALVLGHGYRLKRETVAKSLRAVLGLPNVSVQNPADVSRAIALFEEGIEFSHALHIASSTPAAGFRTFDPDLIRQSKAAGIGGVGAP